LNARYAGSSSEVMDAPPMYAKLSTNNESIVRRKINIYNFVKIVRWCANLDNMNKARQMCAYWTRPELNE
jgi:hypothetical protein